MSIGQTFLSLAFWLIVVAILIKIVRTWIEIVIEAIRSLRQPEQSLGEFFESFENHNFEDPNKRVRR